MSGQMALIDTGLAEGSFDYSLGLKQLLSREFRDMDRWMIAAQLSKSTNVEITKDTLDKRLSSDPAYQMYAIHMSPICKLIGNQNPYKYLLEPLGSDVLNPDERELLELTRLNEHIKQLEARKLHILKKFNLEVKP
jgi:hypothetical protein